YNNIFVQKYPVIPDKQDPKTPDYSVVGTSCFDIFPAYDEWYANFKMDEEPDMGALATYHFGHLPVWVEGNAYFNGATVSKHEKNGFIDTDSSAELELICKDGKYTVKTNVYDLLGDYKDNIINTDTLGIAFEPEQRFENPDGTDIIFDRDYLNEKRSINTIPGPFADSKNVDKVLF
ncbi:MAG: hypothetical protein K6B68_10215, partial [Eubacterium sp.]|nr:hypothetical protein [Eubacterium sp.]